MLLIVSDDYLGGKCIEMDISNILCHYDLRMKVVGEHFYHYCDNLI